MQTSSENLKKLNFNSITIFSKVLHDDNILRVFDIKFKRRRLYNVNELSFSDEKKQLSKKSTKAFTRSKKKEVKRKGKKKTMKPILSMINKSKVNVKNILIHNNIILPALYLYQIFLYFRNETKRLIQASKKLKKKKEAAQKSVKKAKKKPVKKTTRQKSTTTSMKMNYAAVDTKEEETHWTMRKYHDTIINEKAAFDVSAILFKDGKEFHVKLSSMCSKANQGSDLILINDGLAKELKLRYRSTKNFSFKSVTMIVVDGNHTKLNHWVIFTINVKGIKRIVWAFVNSRNTFTNFFLKMSWLKTINAVIDIPNKTITIKDTKKRKITKIINSYIMNSKTLNFDKKNKKLTKKKLTKLKKIIKRVVIRETENDSKLKYFENDESSKISSIYNFFFKNEYENF